jgi:hypothetical protein
MWNYIRFNCEYVPYALIQQFMPEQNNKSHVSQLHYVPCFGSTESGSGFPLALQNPDTVMLEDADPGFLRQKFEKQNLHLTKMFASVDSIESGSNPDPKQGCTLLNSTLYTLKLR